MIRRLRERRAELTRLTARRAMAAPVVVFAVTLAAFALAGASPDVAPEMTIVPPGLSELTECDQVAAPTVSMTASTRSGSRSPEAKTRSAPISRARSPRASSRDVTHIR